MQHDKGVAYISSQDGWQHIGHYEDVGLSGYDPNVFRPGFEQMMEDARARKFDVVVIYMLSRLTRQGAAEALAIQKELADHGVALVSTQEPFINTSGDNPFGVAFFALIAGLAHQESKNKSKFIRDAFAELKAKGSHSSGPVPFGFKAEPVQVDNITIRKLSPAHDEAGDAVKRAIELAMDGHPMNAVASKLTDEGIKTPLERKGNNGDELRAHARSRRKNGAADEAPGEWSATVVTRMLRDPRLAGFAIGPVDPQNRRRTILRDENDEPVRPHEGFMSAHDWYRLQQILDGRKREKSQPRTGEQTLLGSWGILHCGRCGSGMTNTSSQGGTYICNLRRTVGDEPKHVLRIARDAVNEAVVQRVWAHVAGMDPDNPEHVSLLRVAAERFAAGKADPEALAELTEQEAHLQHVQDSLAQLYQDRAEGLYKGETGTRLFAETVRKYQAFEETTMARIEELRAAATATVTIPLDEWMQDGENPLAPGGLWESWDMETQRAFLALWVDRIQVVPATVRGLSANTAGGRVEIDWAGCAKVTA